MEKGHAFGDGLCYVFFEGKWPLGDHHGFPKTRLSKNPRSHLQKRPTEHAPGLEPLNRLDADDAPQIF